MSEVTIYYLEMLNQDQHIAKACPADLTIEEACVKQYQVNRMLYGLIGESWQWNDKADWSSALWKEFAEADSLRTWIAYHRGSIAGYFELKRIDSRTTEIAYFGLAQKFIGMGFGGALLSKAVTEAWGWSNTERITLNTCSLDHPHALANYRARGFSVYKEKNHP